jgi:hypothetical protein
MNARDIKSGQIVLLGFVIVRVVAAQHLPDNVTVLHLQTAIKPITIPSDMKVTLCDDDGNAISEV